MDYCNAIKGYHQSKNMLNSRHTIYAPQSHYHWYFTIHTFYFPAEGKSDLVGHGHSLIELSYKQEYKWIINVNLFYIGKYVNLFIKEIFLIILVHVNAGVVNCVRVPLTPCRLRILGFQNCDLNIHYQSNPVKKKKENFRIALSVDT